MTKTCTLEKWQPGPLIEKRSRLLQKISTYYLHTKKERNKLTSRKKSTNCGKKQNLHQRYCKSHNTTRWPQQQRNVKRKRWEKIFHTAKNKYRTPHTHQHLVNILNSKVHTEHKMMNCILIFNQLLRQRAEVITRHTCDFLSIREKKRNEY